MGFLQVFVCAYVLAVVVFTQPFTRIPAEDLTVKTFSGCCGEACDNPNGPVYYRYLVPSKRSDGYFYVGAMNFLFKLNTADLSCMKHNRMGPDADAHKRCKIQGKNAMLDCQNHVRVVMEMEPNTLHICGTGAYFPHKYELDETTFNVTASNGRGYGVCPYDPLDNATAILVENGNPGNATAPYYGTYTDFIKNKPVFYRPSFTWNEQQYMEKSTDWEDVNHLNLPQFVGSFDVDREVYTFFREVAVEYPSSNVNKVYSRVAKVCKGDLGSYMRQKKWLSFVKARLNCSLPGMAPYDFDEIYDIYRSGDLFYGLFYRQGAELNASAICVFNRSEIEAAFSGKFKYKNPAGHWITLPNSPDPRLDNCYEHDTNPEQFRDTASQYQLMDTNVDSVFKKPIFYKHGVQMLRINVGEQVQGSRNIYVATTEGEVYDIFEKTYPTPTIADTEPTVVLNAVYEPFVPADNTIWGLKLINNDLIMGSDYKVGKIHLEDTCHQLKKIDSCIYNTRCKWDKTTSKCIKSSESSSSSVDHTIVEAGKNLIETLKDKNIIDTVLSSRSLPAISGIYTRLDLETIYRVSDVIWKKEPAENRAKRDATKPVVLDSDKFAKSSTGDLIIRNVTMEDQGVYVAYSESTNTPLVRYFLNVTDATNQDAVVAVWKQQFNDWSSAFSKWSDCADNYLNTCQKGP